MSILQLHGGAIVADCLISKFHQIPDALGEAVFFGSLPLLVWFLVFCLVNAIYISGGRTGVGQTLW
jgi:hypothetical protein